MKYFAKTLLASVLVLPISVYAAEEEKEPGWTGVGEFGLVNTTGNTETLAINLKLEFVRTSKRWRHRFAGTALATAEDGIQDNERYTAEIQSDRKFAEKSWMFGVYRYDADKFGAFDPSQTATFGYGRNLMKSKKHQLKGEIGGGYRNLKETTTGVSSSEAIIRFLLDDSWQVFKSTRWTNRLLIESGADNTFSQLNSDLNVSMTEALALKFGFEIRNNTRVPPGDTEKTDTITTMNLVYNF